MRGTNKLSVLKIRVLTRAGRYGDGNGLWLQVSISGTKSWLFRYTRNGKARQMGLGSVDLVPLAKARLDALEARRLLLSDVDPIDERQNKRAARRASETKKITFRMCCEQFIAARNALWKNEKHRKQWSSTLERFCFPIIGDRSISDVGVNDVLRVLEPVWRNTPETAKRLRGRIESVLSWAAVRGYRSADNPARWSGHLDQILPKPSAITRTKHHAALPYNATPAFFRRLKDRSDVSTKALRFTILTAARTGEVLGARWNEIDRDTRIWNVPAARMKSGRDHRVPLSTNALEVLISLPLPQRQDDYIFPGRFVERPLSNMAMMEVLRELQVPVTVHGFRSTFRDWAAECANYENFIVEMALAHVVGDKVEAAYRRGDLLAKRRALMEEWGLFCNRIEGLLHSTYVAQRVS